MVAPTHHSIPDPVFSWPPSGWLFTLLSALIGSALFLVPRLAELPLLQRLLVFGLLVLVGAALPFLLHLGRRYRAVARRAREYNAVVTSLDEAKLVLDRACSLISKFVQERREKNSLRIAYCYVFNGKPLIALRRKRGFSVNVGDEFTVVDLEVGRPIGTFEVTEDTGDHYVARCLGDMDMLWLGYMKQAGSVRSESPPGALAIRFPVEENSDDKEDSECTT